MALDQGLAAALADIVGHQHVLLDDRSLTSHATSACTVIRAVPEAVVRPFDAAEVSEVMRCAHEAGVAVVPRCALTNDTARIILRSGGIVLSTDRMNRILYVNAREWAARVQPCVSGEQLNAAARAAGLDGLDDGSRGVDSWLRVIGAEAVLPSGKIVRTGASLLAAPMGEGHLSQLLAGPDGTLAVLTELTLALDSARTHCHVAVAYFARVATACNAMRAVIDHGVLPSQAEFLDRASIIDLDEHAHLGLHRNAEAMLLFVADPASSAGGGAVLERICALCSRCSAEHATVVTNTGWCRALSDALRHLRPRWQATRRSVPMAAASDLRFDARHGS